MFKIKLMGAIRLDWGEKFINVNQNKEKDTHLLRDILIEIKGLKKAKFGIYFDDDLTPKRGTIIIVNGMDYIVNGGLESKISIKDEVILIPTISGG